MSDIESAVRRAVKTFRAHPECLGAELTAIDKSGAQASITLNVEMPLAWRGKGYSPNGVRREETIEVRFAADYPWSAPRFYLRDDFDRSLPHIQPGSTSDPPQPCLVYGSLDEYFLEVGLLALVEQLRVWLCRAAKGALINPAQGWEPIVRNDLQGEYIADANHLRKLVNNRGGSAILKAGFLRTGPKNGQLSVDSFVLGRVFPEKAVLNLAKEPELIIAQTTDGKLISGKSIAIVVWPGKLSTGERVVADRYFPETVETLGDLLARSRELSCEASLRTCLERLDKIYETHTLNYPVPIAVFMCIRRPYNLIGIDSSIELLPYAFDLKLDRKRKPLTKQTDLPVIPVTQLDTISPALLQAASGAERFPSTVVFGCGSVGSKVAIHIARRGSMVNAVVDSAWLRPHNLARHGLAQVTHEGKATALVKTLASLGQNTMAVENNLLSVLKDKKRLQKVVGRETEYVIDTTASLRVRSLISALVRTAGDPQFVAMALFGEGRGAYLLVEGNGGSPSLDDMTNAYYEKLTIDSELRDAAAETNGELQHVATGQGCGSLTMPMADTRVSSMSAELTEWFLKVAPQSTKHGQLIIGVQSPDGSRTQWDWRAVLAPRVVEIPGGWQFRLSAQAVEKIQSDISRYPDVETGGILMGRVNDRLRSVSVVDVLPAPPDSLRSRSGFVLGINGVKSRILDYHERSGKTLYDVGTWHSHLADEPPSPRDKETAKQLAAERPPPYALLIVSPKTMYGVMHSDSGD